MNIFPQSEGTIIGIPLYSITVPVYIERTDTTKVTITASYTPVLRLTITDSAPSEFPDPGLLQIFRLSKTKSTLLSLDSPGIGIGDFLRLNNAWFQIISTTGIPLFVVVNISDIVNFYTAKFTDITTAFNILENILTTLLYDNGVPIKIVNNIINTYYLTYILPQNLSGFTITSEISFIPVKIESFGNVCDISMIESATNNYIALPINTKTGSVYIKNIDGAYTIIQQTEESDVYLLTIQEPGESEGNDIITGGYFKINDILYKLLVQGNFPLLFRATMAEIMAYNIDNGSIEEAFDDLDNLVSSPYFQNYNFVPIKSAKLNNYYISLNIKTYYPDFSSINTEIKFFPVDIIGGNKTINLDTGNLPLNSLIALPLNTDGTVYIPIGSKYTSITKKTISPGTIRLIVKNDVVLPVITTTTTTQAPITVGPDVKSYGDYFQIGTKWYKYIMAGSYPLILTTTTPCLLKGSSILTPSGYKLIETLSEGDFIVTHDGNIMPILKCSKQRIQWVTSLPQDKLVYKIEGKKPIYLTAWHKVMQQDGSMIEAMKCGLPLANKSEYCDEDDVYEIYHINVKNWYLNNLVVDDGSISGKIVESWSGDFSGKPPKENYVFVKTQPKKPKQLPKDPLEIISEIRMKRKAAI